jgi:hypothetical protein
VRSGSVDFTSCLNVMATLSLEVGPVHVDLASSMCSGSASENAPLVMWPGSPEDSVASPAVEMIVAVVLAVYSMAAPGVNVPKLGVAPSASESGPGR